ncbi:MAG: O-antigen ligase family protein [Verrucomicrobiota bacterium]
MEFYYQDFWRMDWGLGNPNKTAALIATGMVAVWALAFFRRWGFWLALVLFVGLGACLVHTYSRGGMLALAAGLVPLLIFARRPWPKTRLIALGLAFWALIGLAVYWQAHERLTQGIAREDRSITNRLAIWSAAPAMMTDAPGGWGYGRAGQAYMQWYQPLDAAERYRTLVNSHLTWLVEFGWPLRWAYLFAWGAVLLLCWPGRATRWLAVPMGVWISFGIGATFSSVAESPWLWILPIISLLPVLGYRLWCVHWPRPRLWLAPAGAAAVACVALWVAGLATSAGVHGGSERVLLGSGAPATWVVIDETVVGQSYGKTLRRFLKSRAPGATAIGLVLPGSPLPAINGEQLILTGKISGAAPGDLGELMRAAGRVTLLSPRFFPQEVRLEPDQLRRVETIFGEFSQSPTTHSWKEHAQVRTLRGVGDYIPDWTNLILPPAT